MRDFILKNQTPPSNEEGNTPSSNSSPQYREEFHFFLNHPPPANPGSVAACWHSSMRSWQAGSTTVTLFCMARVRTSLTVSSRSWTRLRGWFWTFPSSAELSNIFRHPWWTALVADREVYTLQDRSSCPALHRWDGRSTWWNCAVRWACLPADKLCGLPLVVTL